MISKESLEAVFKAWYDHKMEPEDADLLKQHRATMNRLKDELEMLLGHPTTVVALRQAIGSRFGAWMKENGLPKPPR